MREGAGVCPGGPQPLTSGGLLDLPAGLREVDRHAYRVVDAELGEAAVARARRDLVARPGLLGDVPGGLAVLDLEAEVLDALLALAARGQDGQVDVAIGEVDRLPLVV